MKISKLIEQLQKTSDIHGDIEVTCTASLEPDAKSTFDKGPFESTVETLIVNKTDPLNKKVRLYF